MFNRGCLLAFRGKEEVFSIKKFAQVSLYMPNAINSTYIKALWYRSPQYTSYRQNFMYKKQRTLDLNGFGIQNLCLLQMTVKLLPNPGDHFRSASLDNPSQFHSKRAGLAVLISWQILSDAFFKAQPVMKPNFCAPSAFYGFRSQFRSKPMQNQLWNGSGLQGESNLENFGISKFCFTHLKICIQGSQKWV